MAPQVVYTPKQCLHCGEGHSPTQINCYHCNGYTLPTKDGNTLIHWEVFELHPSCSAVVQATQLKSAVQAMETNIYVAAFRYKFFDREDTLKTMLFVYRPGGKKGLSFCTRAYRRIASAVIAHVKTWEYVTVQEWEQFVEVLGERKCFHGLFACIR
jgi:hypothetical protein